jgi:uroporphyrinogen-III synthase
MPTHPMVILTREAHDNRPLRETLEALEVAVREVPCTGTRLLPVDTARLAHYDAVAVTSQRAVAAAAQGAWCDYPGLLGAVGQGTAAAMTRVWGRAPDLVAPDGTGESLGHMLADTLAGRGRVVHLRGSKTTGTLQAALEAAGLALDEVVSYENVAPEIPRLTDVPSGALVVFASPSAARRFFAVNDHLLALVIPVAIGPTTADSLRGLGAREPLVASAPTLEALTELIRTHIWR